MFEFIAEVVGYIIVEVIFVWVYKIISMPIRLFLKIPIVNRGKNGIVEYYRNNIKRK